MPNKNGTGKSKNQLHIPKMLPWRYIFIFLVKMFRLHFLCIGACKSVLLERFGYFVLKLVPSQYFWHYKLFIVRFYIEYTDIDNILFLWFGAFRQFLCQNRDIFVYKRVKYDNFLWKKPHILAEAKFGVESKYTNFGAVSSRREKILCFNWSKMWLVRTFCYML